MSNLEKKNSDLENLDPLKTMTEKLLTVPCAHISHVGALHSTRFRFWKLEHLEKEVNMVEICFHQL